MGDLDGAGGSVVDELRRRIERDPEWVFASISADMGYDVELVERVITVVRRVVDDLLADGYVVVPGDLILSIGDSPTRRALLERLASSDPVPELVLRLEHEAVAGWLGLDWEVYCDRPLANRSLIGAETFNLLGDAAPSRAVVWDILEAWDDSFADGRAYKVGSAGLEAALERWLIANLDRLAEHGLPVTLTHQQRVLPNGKRPDLICRFTEDTADADAGDWLVIELKATRFYSAAADQVAGYVEQVVAHLAAPGERVVALLITDGADHFEVEGLRERGIGHLSLAALGYRLALAQRSTPSASTTLSVPASRFTAMGNLTNDELFPTEGSEMDGPTVYWVRIFHDVDSGETEEAREQAVAATLWSRREERRRDYERDWGAPDQWPAQHPTTVITLKAHNLSVAVCIRCDWLARSKDESGNPVDLHTEAKGHALGHTHDPALDRGENPPKPSRHVRGLANRFEEARANAQRAARRVALRASNDTDTE